jgi:tetratricopeptide (TPR) repeat protein/transcriptional regulator with XRE-family HTH domain
VGRPQAPLPGRSPYAPLAAQLRELRGSAGLTLRALAARSGYSPSALAVAEGGRRLPSWAITEAFVEACGEKSSQWRHLWQATARGSSASSAELATDVNSQPGRKTSWIRPAQLPRDVPDFTGRDRELDRLRRLVADASGHMAICLIDGPAGAGKTTLAVHFAHSVADQFPKGQLYVNLYGFGPSRRPVTPPEAIHGFLAALGLPPGRLPPSLDAQAGLYRSMLAGRRMLVLLDNARDAEQVRPLLPGSPACLVIVTSRNQFTSLVATESACPVTLGMFTAAESREFLGRRLGADRLVAEPAAVDELARLCARLPLALGVAAARAAARPDFPLATLTAQLQDARGRLDVLDGGDQASDVRAVFSWSYRALSEQGANLFRLLALHPGPSISLAAAASLSGTPPAQTASPLSELTREHMLLEPQPGRYSMHDLLRAYAGELLQQQHQGTGHHAAVSRMLDHYLLTAHSAVLLLDEPRYPRSLCLPAPQSDVVTEDLATREQALAWFQAEHQALIAAVADAADAGYDAHAWQLAWTLAGFLDFQGQWKESRAVQRIAQAAAVRLGDQAGIAAIHRGLGRAEAMLGQDDEAEIQLSGALRVYRELADPVGQAHVHMRLGWLRDRQGRSGDAIRSAEQALAIFLEQGDRAGQTVAFGAIAWSCAHLSNFSRAMDCVQQALTLARELGEPGGQACHLDTLGYIHHQLGQLSAGVTRYRQAAELYGTEGHRRLQADTLIHLGDAQHAAGRSQAAREAWDQALRTLDDLHDPAAEQVRARLGGYVSAATGPRRSLPTA